jgi:hypothetical protein
VEGTTDTFRLTASLLNTSTETLTLTKFHPYFGGRNFEEHLRQCLILRTSPPTHSPEAQTLGGAVHTVSRILKPGERLFTTWDTQSGCLKPCDVSLLNLAPCLVEPGTYAITARLLDDTFDDVTLLPSESAPVSIAFGSSSVRPRATMLKVTTVDFNTSHAMLEGGKAEGVQVGDQYCLTVALGCRFVLSIRDTYEHSSRASVSYTGDPTRLDMKLLPLENVWRADTDRVPCDMHGSPR